MSIKRIEISIKDKNRFGLVAFLVDRPDFLGLIEKIRGNLKIKSFPYTFTNSSFPYEEANNTVNYYKKGVCSIYDVYSCFKDISEARALAITELDYTLALAFEYAEGIIERLGKTKVYLPVVLASLLVGSISEGDVLPTNTFTLDKYGANQPDDRFINSAGNSNVIIVHKESTLAEVKTAFNYIKKEQLLNSLPDTVTNIKRDREWYWQHKEGVSYEEIRKNTKKANQPATWQAVRNAIFRYKAHLA